MWQMIKKILWIAGLMLCLPNAWAYSLLGPVANGPDAWQVTLIGYNPLPSPQAPPYILDSDAVGPKNLGEEYRRNTPIMYYAADANFLDYFGSNGMVTLDGTFAMLNNVLTNGVDSYDAGLTQFPLSSSSVNYSAQSMELLDLGSIALSAMLEQLGLADPVRYTWCLHDRYLPPTALCQPPGPGTGVLYLVIQRNFDITATSLSFIDTSTGQYGQYSPYVNGELYSYRILENCGAAFPFSPPDADAWEVPVDAIFNNHPVAGGSYGEEGLNVGEFYTGLTRDDVAGLRYLLSTNTINREDTTLGSLLISSTSGGSTNIGAPFVLYTSDYTALVLSSQTNDPATLMNLFPGLVVSSSLTNFTGVLVPNIVFVTNPLIGAPAGTMQLGLATNGFIPVVLTNYTDTFANVVFPSTNNVRSYTSARIMTVTTGPLAGAPAGTLYTNTTFSTMILTNVPSGDYYILTNPCGQHVIVRTLLTNVVATTNLLIAATNAQRFSISESLVTYTTNHVYVAEPIVCASGGTTVGQANVSGLFQGVGRIQFIREDYDSLLGQFFQPIASSYSMVFITNSQAINQSFQRVVTTPDFLFSAADLVSGPAAYPVVVAYSRNFNFDQNTIYPGLAGPGIINPPSTLTFDKVGPVYQNQSPFFMLGPNLNELFWVWGSFDGSTNAPIVYPNGTSIQNLAAEVLIQISPASLPNGTTGAYYSFVYTNSAGIVFTNTFSATGGQSPYTWSVASGSALPPGLSLLSSGVIAGTPTQSGQYVVTIQMTDAANRTVTMNYSITIN
jgi:hypothetical protein